MFADNIIHDAQRHACRSFPHESVGFVAHNEYIPLKNISPTPETNFEIAPRMWLQCPDVQAVIHSHPNGCDYPSASDMEHQICSNVPWGITVCNAETASDLIWFGDQCPIPPLTGIGRPFRHGVTDCYSLIRDYYRTALGITLKEFPRDWEWWLNGGDLYSLGFSQTGFTQLHTHQVRPGDVFLATVGREAIRRNIPSHGGVYLGGSGDIILHHLSGAKAVDYTRFAVEEPGVRYLKYVTHWLRHEDVK